MALFRDGDESGLPDAPVVIVDAEGQPTAGVESESGRPAGRTRLPDRRRLAIVLAVVVAFAFGAVVGRASIRTESGTAIAGSTTSERPASTTHEAPASAPGGRSSPAPTNVVPSSQASLSVVTGACGQQAYVAQVGYVSPLPEPIDMKMLAGSPPRMYDLSNGTVGPPLLQFTDDREFVQAIVADDQGTVLVVRACTDPMAAAILRITNDRPARGIEAPTGWGMFGQLTTVGGKAWAVLTRVESGKSIERLLATDGSGKTMPMPDIADSARVAGIVSPDGRRVVTRELNTDGTPGFHLQFTDLDTGKQRSVPGIRLGNASASVDFSPDSRWLIVAVPTLSGGRILFYSSDNLNGPYSIPGVAGATPGTPVPIYIPGT